MIDIGKLIATEHSVRAEEAYCAFGSHAADLSTHAETSRNLLGAFPPMPRARAMMRALYAMCLRANSTKPAYAVAGPLRVGHNRVFGDGKPINGSTDILQNAPVLG